MANTIEVIIKQTGSGNAIADTQKALGGLGSAASGATGMLGGFGNALGNMATIAGGIVAANIFGRIVDGISSFVTTGLSAVGSSQMLETSLKSLLTANHMYEQSTETVTTAITKQLMTQDELGNKTAELTAKLATQQATYQEQQERIRQLTDEYGDNGLVVIKTKAQHDQLALSIQATEREIANLSTTETKYSTTQKTVWQQTMDQADAYKIAQRETKGLLAFVSQLAVVSPFETETVEQTTKYAVAAGLGLKQTKEFVPAFLDLAASVGITSDELGFAADQLFQVKKIGKLTEIDLRQLRRLGIDLGKVIGIEMGMSVEEFNKQAEKSPEIFDELFDAVTRFSQNTFAGTSKEMALSVKGLQSTLNDVFVIGARTFIRPFVDAFTPAIAGIVGKLSDFVLGGDLASMGQQMAATIMGGFERFQKFGAGGLAAMLGFEGGALFFRKISVLMGMVGDKAGGLADIIRNVLGASFEWLQSNLFPILSKGVQFLIDGFEIFQSDVVPIIDTIVDKIQTIATVFSTLGLEGGLAVVGQMIANELSRAWTEFIQPQLMSWKDQFFDWIAFLYPQIPTFLTGIVSTIASWLTDNWPIISAALSEWSAKFWDWAKEAATNAANVLNALAVAILAWATSPDAQSAMGETGHNIGLMIADSIKQSFIGTEGTSSILLTLASGLLNGVTAITGTLIIMGGEIVAGILSGILTSLGVDLHPATFNQLGTILTQIGTDIKTIAVWLGNQIIINILSGLNQLIGNINEFFATGVEGWQGIVLDTDWLKLGQSVIDGILEGLKKNGDKVLEYLKNLIGVNAYQTIMSAIGAGSPATMYFPVGQSIIDGIAAGARQAAPSLNNVLSRIATIPTDVLNRLLGKPLTGFAGFSDILGKAADPMEKFLKDRLGGAKGKFALDAFKKALRAHWTEVIGADGNLSKSAAEQVMKNAVSNWEKAGIKLDFGLAAQVFAENFNDALREQKLLDLEELGKGLGIAGQFASFGQAAAQRLQDRIDILGQLVEAGGGLFEGQTLDALQAQELLNAALEDQASVQAQILDLQRQQADLQFLQQQLDLIKLIQEQGLNVEDILGGITLGLNASLPDIIAAMNAVVEAMIGQLDDSLGIASPSRVMMEKFQQVGAGAVQGLLSTIPAIRDTVVDLASQARSTVTRSTNYYFNQTVNTQASASTVISDFGVMKSLVGV